MAIDYDSGSGLFDKVGTVVSLANALDTWQTSTSAGNLEKEFSDLEAKLEDTKQFDAVARDLLLSKWDQYRESLNQMKLRLVEMTRLLMASEIVIQEGTNTDNLQDLLTYLKFAMVRDSETVDENTVSLGSTTNNFPWVNFYSSSTNPIYGGVDGRMKGDKIHVVASNVDNPLAEQLNLFGTQRPRGGAGDPNWQYLGDALSTTVYRYKESRNRVGDPSFEDVNTSKQLNKWSLITGTYGSAASIEVLSGGIAFDGSNYLNYHSNAELTQVVLGSSLKPRTSYILVVIYQGGTSADGTFYYGLDYTGCNNSFAISAGIAALQSTKVFKTPDVCANTIFRLRRTAATAGDFYVANIGLFEMPKLRDSMYLLPLYGVGPSSQGKITPINRDENYVATITNDQAGTFQTYFGRFMNFLLPANGSGAETISDTLAA